MPPSPFTVHVADSVLDDLRARLARTRLPARTPGPAWAAGTDPDYLRKLLAYWADGFDWRAREQALNAVPHYRADLDGQLLHFVHVPGVGLPGGPAPLPLLLTHGWPSTFAEMLPLLPLLTDPGRHGGDPADAFDVVVPSLPGHIFSDLPPTGPVTRPVIADALARLMTDVLGYQPAAPTRSRGIAMGRRLGSRAAMCSAMCSASLPTPPTSDEASAVWKTSPTKYRPGSDPTMPRSCTGPPASARTRRSIQSKSGTHPVHQSTLATSRSRPSSSTGRPPRAPAVLGTRSIPAAVMSLSLTRASGRPREWPPPPMWNLCRTARLIGVFTVSTWVAMNQITGMRSRSPHLLLPGR
jgi:hypothetical protein